MTNLEKYYSRTEKPNARLDLYVPKEILHELEKMSVAERIEWLLKEVEE